MSMREYVLKSNVEIVADQRFGQNEPFLSVEKIRKIVIPDFELLGKLAALRFIEWCQLNPAGVVSLATGKTPKTFIKWIQYFLENWHDLAVQQELESWHINIDRKPDFKKFVLVQMDEYFPMKSSDEKSFYSYISANYIKNIGFDPDKCLLMNISQYLNDNGIDLDEVFPDGNVDIALKSKKPQNSLQQQQARALELMDDFTKSFETKINSLGGIGFFLGGIGPDGHVAFNFKGEAHSSVTRLLPINYESAAAASASFGGIEFVRNKGAVTIGLGTITQNLTTTAIILADGVGKADVVRNAIESNVSEQFPATALHGLTGARFYLTTTAASELKTQKYLEFKDAGSAINDWGQQVLIDLAVEQKKEISQLTEKDVEQSFFGDLFVKNSVDLNKFIAGTVDSLKYKLERGTQPYSGKVFLHTSPHADDVTLGYLPLIDQLSKDKTTSHYFTVMTSGANTVQNPYFESLLNNLDKHLTDFIPLKRGQDNDLADYFVGVKQANAALQEKALASRLLRCLIKFLNIDSADNNLIALIRDKISEIKSTLGRGQNNSLIIDLKRCVREWEEDLVWGHFGFGCANVHPMNLGFYASKDKSIIFERDVQPVVDLLEKIKPDVVTVALDPKDGGHPTHYKVSEIMAQALKVYNESVQMDSILRLNSGLPRTDSLKPVRPELVEGLSERGKIEVWGYNNVWFKFSPTQANLFFTASDEELRMLCHIFKSCYTSQVPAAVPSPEYDGPFCDLVQKIMRDQINLLKQCLGHKIFTENSDKKIAEACGVGFIKEMTVDEFLAKFAI